MSKLASVGVLSCELSHLPRVLELLEQKGFDVVGVAQQGTSVLLAFRVTAAMVHCVEGVCAKMRSRAAPSLVLVADQDRALSILREHFAFKQLLHWQPANNNETILGSPGRHPLHCYNFADLCAPCRPGAGSEFCAQLRRDGYVPLLVSSELQQLYSQVEADAARWFAQSEDDKFEQAGAYGHIDRKFTGYRQGSFREQLEVRSTADGSAYPRLCGFSQSFADRLARLLAVLDGTARQLLLHLAEDVGVDASFFDELTDAPPSKISCAPTGNMPPSASQTARASTQDGREDKLNLAHSLIRICRYDSNNEGVAGSGVLCEAHNDVGLITLDPCAAVPGLQALRRSDGMWVPVEEVPARPDGALVVMVMVGDTLGRLTKNYYAPCKHRVVAPPSGERIGLPYLFRGRSDAVLNTRPALEAARLSGRTAHLAEMESVTVKELPAFDSAKSILRNWFHSVKRDKA